jgi:hypothetical protein
MVACECEHAFYEREHAFCEREDAFCEREHRARSREKMTCQSKSFWQVK